MSISNYSLGDRKGMFLGPLERYVLYVTANGSFTWLTKVFDWLDEFKLLGFTIGLFGTR